MRSRGRVLPRRPGIAAGARSHGADDEGSATLEFALVAPAVLLLVAASVSAFAAAGEAIHLADAAGTLARAAGRGDPLDGRPAAGGASVRVSGADPVCVRLERAVSLPVLGLRVPVSASSCAPGGGR